MWSSAERQAANNKWRVSFPDFPVEPESVYFVSCPTQGRLLENFCPKHGQDFKPSAAPLYNLAGMRVFNSHIVNSISCVVISQSYSDFPITHTCINHWNLIGDFELNPPMFGLPYVFSQHDCSPNCTVKLIKDTSSLNKGNRTTTVFGYLILIKLHFTMFFFHLLSSFSLN